MERRLLRIGNSRSPYYIVALDFDTDLSSSKINRSVNRCILLEDQAYWESMNNLRDTATTITANYSFVEYREVLKKAKSSAINTIS